MTPSNRGRQMARSGNWCNYCRACRRAWKNARRRQAKGGILLDGATREQRISLARRAAWVRQREAGYTGREAGLASVAAQTATPRRWCRKGLHQWVPENLIVGKRRKTCKWCAKATNARRAERQLDTAAVERLRQARIAAHPDKGGTVEAFIAADRAWRQFQEGAAA